MAEPLPVELRQRVVEAYERGEGSYASLAEEFDVGICSVRRWVGRYRDVGHVQPRKKGGGNRSDISVKDIEGILDKLGDANAGEITAEYNRGRRGKDRRHVSSIKRALYRAGYVVKKSASGRSSSSAPTLPPSATPSDD